MPNKRHIILSGENIKFPMPKVQLVEKPPYIDLL